MKSQFAEYLQRTDDDYKKLLGESLVILDTNALLNLYRYKKEARAGLLNILEKFAERLWIPHHVGLEFNRGRVGVIQDQHKRIKEIRAAVNAARSHLEGCDKRRGSQALVDTDPLLKRFDEAVAPFLSDVDQIEKLQLQITERDEIFLKLQALYENKIGKPPENQQELDGLYAEAESRFTKKIPPGFRDYGKPDLANKCYTHGGLEYQRKFGDFLIWKQILAHARDDRVKTIILVTDDAKDDWWEELDGKTLGPRTELLEESKRVSSVDLIHFYTSDNFIRVADPQISAVVIEQIRDVARAVDLESLNFESFLDQPIGHISIAPEALFHGWLLNRYKEVRHDKYGLSITENGERRVFSVVDGSVRPVTAARIYALCDVGMHALRSGKCGRYTIVITPPTSFSFSCLKLLPKHAVKSYSIRLRLLIGTFDDTTSAFIGIEDMPMQEAYARAIASYGSETDQEHLGEN